MKHDPISYTVPEPVEHTDMVDVVPVYDAFVAMLPVAGGDKVAAAILASAAVVADAIRHSAHGGGDD